MARQILWLTLLVGCEWVFPLQQAPDTPDAPDAGTPSACRTKASALVDVFAPPELGEDPRPNWGRLRNPDDQSLEARVTSAGLEMKAGITGSISVYSDFAYDLVDSRFAIGVSNTQDVVGTNFVRWGVLDLAPTSESAPGQATSAEWTFRDNLLVPTLFDGAPRDIGGGILYDKKAHHYLGFSSNGDKLRWEVSADGMSFTPEYELDLPGGRFVRPYMQVGRTTTNEPNAITTFSQLNHLSTSVVCPAEALQTSFSEENPIEWHRLLTSACTIDVQNDALVIKALTDPDAFSCEYASAGLYDLIDHSVDLAVGAMQLADGEAAYLDLETFDRTRVTLELGSSSGQLRLRGLVRLLDQADNEVFSVVDPGHRFWRLTGGIDLQGKQSITWSTSADGVDYVKRMSFAGLAGLGATRVILGGRGGAGTRIEYDSVGLPP